MTRQKPTVLRAREGDGLCWSWYPITRVPSTRSLLHALGRVQHHLHTAVGLSAVESGVANKPDDLDIAWTSRDRVGSARETRRFLLKATMIFMVEKLNEYGGDVLKYRAFSTGEQLAQSRADRVRALAQPQEIEPACLALAPLMVTHWRNRILHGRSEARLTKTERDGLASAAETIRSVYKGIEISRLMDDFEDNRPTLKEVTVLLSMTTNFVRALD